MTSQTPVDASTRLYMNKKPQPPPLDSGIVVLQTRRLAITSNLLKPTAAYLHGMAPRQKARMNITEYETESDKPPRLRVTTRVSKYARCKIHVPSQIETGHRTVVLSENGQESVVPGQKPATMPNGVTRSAPCLSSQSSSSAVPDGDKIEPYTAFPSREQAADIFRGLDSDCKGELDLEQVQRDIFDFELLCPSNLNLVAVKAYGALSKDVNMNVEQLHRMLVYIHYFNTLWSEFIFFDEDCCDRRVSKEEFIRVVLELGIDGNAGADFFARMDAENAGYVIFDVLCVFCTEEYLSGSETVVTAAGREVSEIAAVLLEPCVNTENKRNDDIELPPQKEMLLVFDSMDIHGNGMVSLSEFEEFIGEQRPEWNNEEAILFAFESLQHNHDAHFIHRNDVPFMLLFIVYYLHFLVKYTEEDEHCVRFIPRSEFVLAAISARLPNIENALETLDKTGTGQVSFQDFCAFCANQRLLCEDSRRFVPSQVMSDNSISAVSTGENNREECLKA
jgi:Ca2+-binding EF-hand superfamily protein